MVTLMRILTGFAAFVAIMGAPLVAGCGGSTAFQGSAGLDGGGRDGDAGDAPLDANVISRDLDAMTVAPIPDTGPDAAIGDVSAEASGRCAIASNPVGGGVGGPTPACTIMWQENCDGIPYYATCACPQGTCSCVGKTTTVVNSFSYKGCADCYAVLPRDIFALCGFPQ
jgi:hypothetical protein